MTYKFYPTVVDIFFILDYWW